MKLIPTTLAGASGAVTLAGGVVVAAVVAVGGAIFIAGSGNSGGAATGQAATGQIGGSVSGAPSPVAGAGLPGIIVAGCGAYWLVRRGRRKSDTGPPRGDVKD
jgi:hypothetical protein